MIHGLSAGQATPESLLHPTGEFSARFMIIAMAATPLRLLFPSSGWTSWLLRNRRYFGVAAFCYALLHTILYIVDKASIQSMVDEFTAIGIWTGWVAFFIFVPMAATSNDSSVRLLQGTWKKIQRAVYVAAVMTLLHWIYVQNNLGPALVHFVPLALLEGYRVWYQQIGPVRRRAGVVQHDQQ